MISYAPNREDVLLGRVFADVMRGFYVDIGAKDPQAGPVADKTLLRQRLERHQRLPSVIHGRIQGSSVQRHHYRALDFHRGRCP